jgi:plasmid stabilization system protein ParE
MAETFEVFWSQSAVSDLDDILDYLAEGAGVDRALALYEKVRRRVASLSRFPRRCRYVPELKAQGLTEFRESILPPYRIFFRLVEGRVILLGVLDSRRDLEELLVQRALES